MSMSAQSLIISILLSNETHQNGILLKILNQILEVGDLTKI